MLNEARAQQEDANSSWWTEDAKVVKPASYLPVQESHLKIKHGREPRVGGSTQKMLKS